MIADDYYAIAAQLYAGGREVEGYLWPLVSAASDIGIEPHSAKCPQTAHFIDLIAEAPDVFAARASDFVRFGAEAEGGM